MSSSRSCPASRSTARSRSEAEWITRDTELLGIDILTAISKAAQRTPSQKLPGVPAGSRHHLHIRRSAEAILPAEGRAVREGGTSWRCGRSWRSLGLMAESFVTVVVAFPLFLVVIMAIMAIVPGGGGSSEHHRAAALAGRGTDDTHSPSSVSYSSSGTRPRSHPM